MCKYTTSKPKEVFVSATRYGFLSVSRQEGGDFDTKYIRADLTTPMIQWTGDNLRDVVEFTGKNPKFDEYFKSWEEFEQYVHAHNDIFKLFYEDGSHYEVPVGAWIVKTPDGNNMPSVTRFVHARKEEQPEVDYNKFEKLFDDFCERNKGHHITSHDACMWFWERGLNARKED